MKKGNKIIKGIFLSSLLTLSFSSSISAEMKEGLDDNWDKYQRYVYDGTFEKSPLKICNFVISDKAENNAKYLHSSRYLIPDKVIKTPEDYNDVYTPNPYHIQDSVVHLLKELQMEGVDVKQFGNETIYIDAIDSDLEGVLGHAFVYYPTDSTLYLYSKFSYEWEPSNVYTTSIHEIGHYVEKKYFDYFSFAEYKKIRGIPKDWHNTDSDWGKHPEEIFAEDFKEIFMPLTMRSYNKTSITDMTDEQKKEIKGLIIKQIKSKENKSELTKLNTFQQLVHHNIIYKNEFLSCDDEKERYLNEYISKNDFSNWFLRMVDVQYPDFIQSENDLELIKEQLSNNLHINLNSNQSISTYEMQSFLLEMGKDLAFRPDYMYHDFAMNGYHISNETYLTRQDASYLIKDYFDKK